MTFDWSACEKKLHEAAAAAIGLFANEHGDERVCCFFFDCDEPCYGHVFISLDSLENNIRSAKATERFAIENRARNLSGDLTWQWAKYQLGTPVLSPFNTNGGDFLYREFAEVEFPEWIEMAEDGYPKGTEHQDDYLESNVRLVLWRVAERLVADRAFDALRLASPFMLGYSIHDADEVILRLLNWPPPK